jgi:hypothetical protein
VLRQPDQETLQLCRVAEISASLLNDRAAERRLFTVSLPSHAMVSVLVHDRNHRLKLGEHGRKRRRNAANDRAGEGDLIGF